ncbi:MAG TPA: DUF1254 domain-containing protein [Gaiellaceae bacterium]|nr:DUF1254 domain-containing protein [Gaiellaceae bacterium]
MPILSGHPRSLAYDAYTFLYPLVMMEVSRRQAINVEAGTRPGFGPPNEFHHIRAFPTAEFRAVVRPNFDTLYSVAWLDLSAGPVVLRSLETDDRYFMLAMLDMWTDVFANPGTRTTGTARQSFAVAGPGYAGELPDADAVIRAPTPWVWVIGRTQTNGPDDYGAVHAIQDGYTVTPLHEQTYTIDQAEDTTTEPLRLVNGMGAVEFFTYACNALLVNPPHPTDYSILARIANIGIVPGEPFDPAGLDAGALDEIEAGAVAAREAIAGNTAGFGREVNGWSIATETIGVYGNAYLKRATVALGGLGANPPEDAVYPLLLSDSDGEPTTGQQDYVIHFDADELPPVDAFWSITMYDAEGYQVANELDRFAIGDRDELTYNPDGSLDIFIQHANPGPEHEANWLPAPAGLLGITMRLYAPRPEILDGRWTPPPVKKQSTARG